MKLKENNGMSLIVFTVVLAVLVILAGGVIVYLLNNPVKEKVIIQNPVNVQSNLESIETNVENLNFLEKVEISKDENDIVNSNIISVATKSDNKICALTNNGNEIELMDISEYNGGVVYTYDNDKLYVYLYKYTPGKTNIETGEVIQEVKDYNTLGYIDLSNNIYEFIKLSNIEAKGSPNSIAVVNNIIYFTSSGFDGIYEYNIDTKKSSVSNDFTFNGKEGIKLYTLSNSKLGYSTAGTLKESPTIGIVDIKNGSKKEISSNASFEYVYNEKIIYKQYDSLNNYSRWKYYECDVNDGSSKQISDITNSDSSIDQSLIIPIDNYYIYVNENSLIKYLNNKSEKIYDFDGFIESINLISDNKLNVVYNVGMNTKYGEFDLNTLKFNNSQNYISYSRILYLK